MSRWSEACASSRQLLIASTETPGPGIAAPRRYTAMMPRENSSFRRRSGVRNAAANACSTCPPLLGGSRLATKPTTPGTSGVPGVDGASDTGGAAPGSGDLLGGRPGEGVRGHVDLHAAQLTGAEHLDRLAAAHRAGLGQGGGVDLAALREQRRDPVEVDDLEH